MVGGKVESNATLSVLTLAESLGVVDSLSG